MRDTVSDATGYSIALEIVDVAKGSMIRSIASAPIATAKVLGSEKTLKFSGLVMQRETALRISPQSTIATIGQVALL